MIKLKKKLKSHKKPYGDFYYVLEFIIDGKWDWSRSSAPQNW